MQLWSDVRVANLFLELHGVKAFEMLIGVYCQSKIERLLHFFLWLLSFLWHECWVLSRHFIIRVVATEIDSFVFYARLKIFNGPDGY